MRAFFFLIGLVGLASCTSRAGAPAAARDAALDPPTPRTSLSTTSAATAPDASDAGTAAAERRALAPSARPGSPGKYDVSVPATSAELAEFFKTHLPKGGSVASENPLKITHTVASG